MHTTISDRTPFVRLSASSVINITGLLATSDGDIKILENIGETNAVTLTFDDAISAATNRIKSSGGSLVLGPRQACVMIYGSTTTRWRVLASGMTSASSAQATALADASVAITPAVRGAGIKRNYLPSSGRKLLATPADGTSGDYAGRVMDPRDVPYGPKAWVVFTGGVSPVIQASYKARGKKLGGNRGIKLSGKAMAADRAELAARAMARAADIASTIAAIKAAGATLLTAESATFRGWPSPRRRS